MDLTYADTIAALLPLIGRQVSVGVGAVEAPDVLATSGELRRASDWRANMTEPPPGEFFVVEVGDHCQVAIEERRFTRAWRSPPALISGYCGPEENHQLHIAMGRARVTVRPNVTPQVV